MSKLRPIELDNPTIRAVIPFASKAFGRAKILNQWLDANFTTISLATSGRTAARGYLSNQPRHFSKTSDDVIAVVTDSSTVNWVMAGVRGHAYTPTTTFTPVRGRWVNKDTFTQLPELCIDTIKDVVDLTSSGVFTKWTLETSVEAIKGRRGSAKEDSEAIAGHIIRLDKLGTISLMGVDPRLRAAFELVAPKKFRGIKLDKLYRGSGDVGITIGEVTKKQVLDGRAFFLYKAKVQVVDQKNTAITTKTVLCLGAFVKLEDMVRYKKARTFLLRLLDSIQNAPERIFDLEAYQEIIDKKAAHFTRHWAGITDIVDFSKTADVPDVYDIVEETLQAGQHVDNKTLRALGAKSIVAVSQEGRDFRDYTQAVDSAKQQRVDALTKKKEAEWAKDRTLHVAAENEKDIRIFLDKAEQLRQRVEELNNSIPQLDADITERDEFVAEITGHLADMQIKLYDAEKAYKKALHDYISDPSATDYFGNMLKSGVVITKLRFVNNQTGNKADLKDMPEIALSDDWSLTTLQMITTRPTRIYIDRIEQGDRAKQIAGGPYEVRVKLNPGSAPEMAIRLASHNSVFGKHRYGNDWQVKPHPHTDDSPVYDDLESVTAFIHQWKACCLGETATSIQQGMNANNPKIVIASVLSWLSSCNTDDEWGRTHHWFPAADDVNFEGRPVATPTAAPLPDISDVLNQIKGNIDSITNAAEASA